MTDKKTEKVVYENPDGEIFDVDGAFKRHPAITPGKANIDLWVKAERHNGLYFELRLSSGTMARLVQILNAAPVNGDPLNATVNLEIDSTAAEHDRERIARYLADNGYDATLENVAAGYVYNVQSFTIPLEIDAAGNEYVVSTVTSISGSAFRNEDWELKTPATINVSVPNNRTITFTSQDLNIKSFKGKKRHEYRIVQVFEPGGYAPYGGVIMERIKDGEYWKASHTS